MAETTEPSGRPLVIPRTLVLVGLMGAGKSAIGRRLAARLGLDFIDADKEIEAAAGCTIADIFAMHGEAAFRDGERKVIQRLLNGPVKVLATGGGAFIDPEIRSAVAQNGISIWLRADLELLVNRCSRRNNRPLLRKGNPREILQRLMADRYPVYAQADLVVDSGDIPREQMVDRVIDRLSTHLREAA